MTRSFIHLISKTPSVNTSKTLLVPSEIGCNAAAMEFGGTRPLPKENCSLQSKISPPAQHPEQQKLPD